MLRTARPSAIDRSVADTRPSKVCCPAVVETQGPADALGLVGSTIDQVRFDACVDAGGFGLIYRGYHEGLGETVAIKCLRIASIQRTNEEMREALAGRFRDETRLLYRLSQGNLDIVRCISSGTLVAPRTHEYTPYMVLEWLDGCTLSAELKERRERGLGPRNLEAAVNLLDSAAIGLAYAHAHDVVHRDVKPGNLFLTRTREGVRMKVLDFGLAKILSDEAIGVKSSVETGVGVHFCSPSYGAPEQYSARIGKIGPSTDVYSLCLVLYEVMLGEKVRPAGNLADGLLKAIDPVTGSPSASALGLRVPPAVEELLQRALAQDPLARPRDAGVFWTALKKAMQKGDITATVADEGLGSAMQLVRDAAVLRASAARPSPFAGTMLMQNAPLGAPHLSQLGAPLPAAGRPNTTSPMMVAGGRFGSVAPPAAPDNAHLTMPFGATSPLAASMSIQSPLHNNAPGSGPPPAYVGPSGPPPNYGQQQQQQQQQQQPQPQQRVGSYPPAAPGQRDARPGLTTDPRMGIAAPAAPRKTGAGSLLAILVSLVLAALGGAFYWFRLRGH